MIKDVVYGLLIIGVIVLLPAGIVGGLKRKAAAGEPSPDVAQKTAPAR
jgi:hypothetical protein